MLQNYNFYKVLSIFLENPTKGFGWRELSLKARLGPPSTKRYVNDMIKQKIILKKKLYGRILYFANRERREYRIYKTFDILIRLEKCGFVDFLNKNYAFPAVVLFGSYATGEATEDSDIDIAIITESKKEVNAAEFRKILKKEIQTHRFNKNKLNILKKQNPSLYNGILNGHVISGYLDVISWTGKHA